MADITGVGGLLLLRCETALLRDRFCSRPLSAEPLSCETTGDWRAEGLKGCGIEGLLMLDCRSALLQRSPLHAKPPCCSVCLSELHSCFVLRRPCYFPLFWPLWLLLLIASTACSPICQYLSLLVLFTPALRVYLPLCRGILTGRAKHQAFLLLIEPEFLEEYL